MYNISKANTQGLELNADYAAFDFLSFGIGYTYLDTEDKDTGRRLLRRPRHTVQVSAVADLTDDIRTGLTGTGYHDSTEFGDEGDDYFLVDFVVDWQLSDQWVLFGRVDNLLDKEYNVVGAGANASRTLVVPVTSVPV